MAKRLLLGFCLSFITQNLLAQNLVSNGDFEQVHKTTCTFIVNPNNISEYLPAWQAPTKGTADLWYTSDTLDTFCTRNLKELGYTAHSGSRCAGIYTATVRYGGPIEGDTPDYREYLQTRLRQPLQKGKTYSVEAYIRRHQYAGTITNNIGFYFSKPPIGNPNSFLPLPVKPQVNIEEPIDSHTQWIKIGGCFVAEDNFEYLTIGNFFDDAHTLIREGSMFNRKHWPYYMLDDIMVKETPVSLLPSASFLGADTTLCPGQSLTVLLPSLPQVDYRWADGSHNLQYTISRSGKYSVVAQIDQCAVRDTIRVNVEQSFQLPRDTSLCGGTPLVIHPSQMDTRAVWSDGSQDSTLSVTSPGLYWLRVPTGHCNLADSMRVEFVNCTPFVPNVFTPNGDGINERFVIDPDNERRLPWHLTILNRWGRLVYETNPYANDWDGGNLPAGVYYYYLENRQYKSQLKGWVTIYR